MLAKEIRINGVRQYKFEEIQNNHHKLLKLWMNNFKIEFDDLKEDLLFHLKEEISELFAETKHYKKKYSKDYKRIDYDKVIEEYVDVLNVTLHFMNAYRVSGLEEHFMNVDKKLIKDDLTVRSSHKQINKITDDINKIMGSNFSKGFEYAAIRLEIEKLMHELCLLAFILDIDKMTVAETYSEKYPEVKSKIV